MRKFEILSIVRHMAALVGTWPPIIGSHGPMKSVDDLHIKVEKGIS